MKMTKRLVFATLVCIPLAFAACGGGDEADSKKAAQQEQKGGQDEVPKKAPASSGDIGDYSFSINNYTLTSDYDGNPATLISQITGRKQQVSCQLRMLRLFRTAFSLK